MPWAAPRFCSKAAHPRFTGARCPLCAHASRKAFDATRPSAAARGYDSGWRAFREDYLRRFPTCSAPGCRATATEVDHIVSIRAGGARFDPANVRPLCKSHHSTRTARDNGLGRREGDRGSGFGRQGAETVRGVDLATSPKLGVLGKGPSR
jgi:5-methylcytosine-specific restriction protein A